MKSLPLILFALLWFGNSHAFPLPQQRSIMPYECLSCDNLPHDTLSMSWPIKGNLLPHVTKHQQTSRKYTVKASLKQLRSGVPIYTQAPGAIIRISPVNQTLVKPEFWIKNVHGINASLMEVSSLFSKDEALNNTPFAGNTSVLAELKPEIGAGELTISSNSVDKKNDDSQFIIHVFDRNSTTELSIQTDKARYYRGDELIATIVLNDTALDCPIDKLTVSLISPNGEITSLAATPLAPNIFQARTVLDSEINNQGANWYVEAAITSIVSDSIIKRQVHSAFSYTIPSGAVEDIAIDNPGSLSFSASIKVATGSRYALSAILFASDNQGKIYPIQTTQSSSWLSAGQHRIHFSFDSNIKTDYKAPYYLGYIRLTDFGQMKPVFEYDAPIEITKLS
ncbi:DUF4785 domain-containing protein [Legionella micdadei]|uniref:Uncharacterized protein n=1 Tax=Legionella micdadei TaxID=451 RepID=A0A098GFT4_LEGMI|nr:DUF4785 domain-containing protein [Legionella micdadei]ARG97208.1 DUF4785 domain-containing protein [Legionella micdadei]KTD29185.1 hypothetical protein Lmic_1105 [Legionella micdadei]NSL17441.1 DUF4785 family protein [Legionella micdadei]CEG61339.1 conserved exported protein of unknown function [Legionella micdadei]SCY38167.1 protein of unknown function [Legionella micdadei]